MFRWILTTSLERNQKGKCGLIGLCRSEEFVLRRSIENWIIVICSECARWGTVQYKAAKTSRHV